MSLDETLAQPGPLLAAWDYRSRDQSRLDIYRVDAGAVLLHKQEKISAKERETTIEKVRNAGIRVGGTYSYNWFVWVFDEQGASVWNAKAKLVDGNADELQLVGGTVRVSDIAAVEMFVDEDDIGHIGVRVRRHNDPPVIAVDRRSKAHEDDPEYNSMSLQEDLVWTRYLASELSVWLGVPQADEDGKVTNEHLLKIRRAALQLADKIAALPQQGDFEHAMQIIGPLPGSAEVSFRFAPNPEVADLRFVELRVTTPSGKSFRGRWIKQGSNEQVAAFLRRVRTPATVVHDVQDMAQLLIADDYA